ncbi:cytoplasmic chaperone [Campylobacter ornithocola]|uniref:Cytoplasmic chaperone n=1 Tax=Campylobacter ornithocola TaxID=1848766 RepID=A0A6M8MXH5_9BACT|nr:molecular chaperone TorD family protein [Campylobacter ornithocola]OCX43657.1 cytoplasmic chaperone [Campylobacter ornithocola]QKF58096.1 putative dimethyl sulfoxide reductase chaperone DmsD [Campylobacter ornithocola]
MESLAIDVFINFLQNPPDKNLLEKLKENKLWENWFLKNDNPLQIEALKLLSCNENEETIGSDFVSLFLSDINFVKAPPFASFYLDKDKEIYSCNSDRVKNIFIINNFLYFLENEPADSLVNELLFIKELLKHNDKKTLKIFLEKDFFTWFNLWNDDLEKGAKSDFYKGFAMLMKDFFEELKRKLINLT